MGFVKDLVKETTKELIEDAAKAAVVTTAAGAITAVTGVVAVGVTGVVKGAQAIGKAATTTKDAVTGFVNSTTEGVDRILEATVGDQETRHYRKEMRYLSKLKNCTGLIVQKVDEGEDIFRIYDTGETLLYRMQGVISKADFFLSLYDEEGQLAGDIYKSTLTKRAPIFHEKQPANYVIDIDDEQVAILKTKLSVNKTKSYEIEPFAWEVQDTPQKKDFSISDDQGVIVHGSKRKGYDVPTYILDFKQDLDELVCLLLMLALIARDYE